MWRFALLLTACGGPPYSLDELPVKEWTAGLPVTGNGKLVVAFLPAKPADWTQVRGQADFICDGCTIGDDETDLAIPVWDEASISFGHLTFDTVRAHVDFAHGRMHFTSRWRSSEVTLDAKIEGTLARESKDIALDGCIVFRIHETLKHRDVKMYSLLLLTGAPLDEHQDYTIKIEGTLGGMKRLGKTCTI